MLRLSFILFLAAGFWSCGSEDQTKQIEELTTERDSIRDLLSVVQEENIKTDSANANLQRRIQELEAEVAGESAGLPALSTTYKLKGKWIRDSDGTVIEISKVDGEYLGLISVGSGDGRWVKGDVKWKNFTKISQSEYKLEDLLKNEEGKAVRYSNTTLVVVDKDNLRGVSGEGLGTDKWKRLK